MFTIKYIMILALLSIGLFVYFTRGKPLVIKTLCSALVFVYALSGALAFDYSIFQFLITGGLLCCLIGDVMISISFITGMAAFAVAHIHFIIAFITAGLFSSPTAPLNARSNPRAFLSFSIHPPSAQT